MKNRPDLRQLTASVPHSVWHHMSQLAEMNGQSLHAYMCELCATHTKHTPIPKERMLRTDSLAEKLPETVQAWIPIRLALRLHSAARQMRDASGRTIQPATLARMLMIHECERTTDIIMQLNEQVKPDFVNDLPFHGKTRYSKREWCDVHLLIFYCSFATRQAIDTAAMQEELSITHLVRFTLDKHLPTWKD